jgi:hypothetical protein
MAASGMKNQRPVASSRVHVKAEFNRRRILINETYANMFLGIDAQILWIRLWQACIQRIIIHQYPRRVEISCGSRQDENTVSRCGGKILRNNGNETQEIATSPLDIKAHFLWSHA